MRQAKCRDFGVAEDAGTGEEADALGAFEGEHAAAAGDDVEDDLGVLPVLELGAIHVEGGGVEGTEEDVLVADHEVAARVAHGGAAVATAAGLMEHEVAVLGLEFVDEVEGGFGSDDLGRGLDESFHGNRIRPDTRKASRFR